MAVERCGWRCGQLPREITRSSRSDRSTSTIWSWWIEGANMCHMCALRKIQWPLSSSTCQKIDHFWMYLAAIWGGLRKKLLMFNTIQLVNTQLWCSGAGSTMADGLHVQTLKPTRQQAILPETQKSTCGWRKVAEAILYHIDRHNSCTSKQPVYVHSLSVFFDTLKCGFV